MTSLDDAHIMGCIVGRPGPAGNVVLGAKPTAGLIVRLNPGPAFIKQVLAGLQAQGWEKVIGVIGRFEPTDMTDRAQVDCTEQGYLTVSAASEVLYTGSPAASSAVPPLPPFWRELATARRSALVYIALTSKDLTDERNLQSVVHRGLVVCAWATVEIKPGWSLEPVH